MIVKLAALSAASYAALYLLPLLTIGMLNVAPAANEDCPYTPYQTAHAAQFHIPTGVCES